MQLGRVVGNVVATRKVDGLSGIKFLLVQPLTKGLEPRGQVIVAADGVAMAGEGELVYFVSSREASLALSESFVPVDDAIVGLVDELDIDPEVTE
jgi:ethanolamine utilization protein EutN